MAWEHDVAKRRPMESPGGLFFRMLVMVTCLVFIPLAAIVGSAFPELVKNGLIERVAEFSGMQSAAAPASNAGAAAAPPFNPNGADAVPTATLTPMTGAGGPAWIGAIEPTPPAIATAGLPAGTATAIRPTPVGSATETTITASGW